MKRTVEEKPYETRPDAWDRFERAVDIALKTPAVRREKAEAQAGASRAGAGKAKRGGAQTASSSRKSRARR
jgi:hypothetical protein